MILMPKFFSLFFNKQYKWSYIKSDLIAGLIVAIVSIPLAVAIAIASSSSPENGLKAAIVGSFFVSFLGGTSVQIGGPTGAFIVITSNIIHNYGYDGLLLSMLIAGLMLIIMGYLRLGQIIKFIPYSIIVGFTAGIASIIAYSQLKNFLGISGDTFDWSLYSINSIALSMGVFAIIMIIFLRKFFSNIPHYLLIIILGSSITAIFNLPIETIGLKFPSLSSSMFNIFSFHGFKINHHDLQDIFASSFVIAFLAGIESLLSAMVADNITGYKHRSNQEIIGVGVANIFSSFVGGLPITGALARTVTNIKAGGKTPLAGIFCALFILIFVYFFLHYILFIPLTILAAILLVVAWDMSEMKYFFHILSIPTLERFIMLATFFSTLFFDLVFAIGIGIILSAFLFVFNMSKVISITYKQTKEPFSLLPCQGVGVLEIKGPLFFGINYENLEILKDNQDILILKMDGVPYLDISGKIMLKKFIVNSFKHNKKIILCNINQQPFRFLTYAGIKNDNRRLFMREDYNDALKLACDLVKKNK